MCACGVSNACSSARSPDGRDGFAATCGLSFASLCSGVCVCARARWGGVASQIGWALKPHTTCGMMCGCCERASGRARFGFNGVLFYGWVVVVVVVVALRAVFCRFFCCVGHAPAMWVCVRIFSDLIFGRTLDNRTPRKSHTKRQ